MIKPDSQPSTPTPLSIAPPCDLCMETLLPQQQIEQANAGCARIVPCRLVPPCQGYQRGRLCHDGVKCVCPACQPAAHRRCR